ncbi:protein kinase domain containing protein [Theileria equi strain WA]|uniref:Protein kinase domain containing protein n=1 Tax=Theileria equi strain WA TaxID=1537102 RepID=L0AVY3_THEEQ|nr:protein kinase domain containing protein [Theileria equi strain WA]AFZ79710.1 protein kinase domain containing protein [Theileria equi strain WA]|eukprot:XP_004829376.1 protein kinase domain containing protein [Theileria equi strain WA]
MWIKTKGKIAIKFFRNIFGRGKNSPRELELSNFILGPTVGTGSYATVCLAALRGDTFAQTDDGNSASSLLCGSSSSDLFSTNGVGMGDVKNGKDEHYAKLSHIVDHHDGRRYGYRNGLHGESIGDSEWQSARNSSASDIMNLSPSCNESYTSPLQGYTNLNQEDNTSQSNDFSPALFTCALKILHKRKIVNDRQTKHLLNEKRILESINHPFIVHYLGSFQDPINVYLILEYVPGGELFTYLRRSTLDLYTTQFYASEILSALDFLHSRSIVYRDLKPENILLDAQGHIRLVDFGFAKRIRNKTFTICGTHEYLAPEIFLRKGHDKSVDLWSLGVLIYEMLVGEAPFYDKDPQRTYRKALENKIYFPPYISESARSIVEALLRVDPTLRLGSRGMAEVWSHAFFRSTKFFGQSAPIKPVINGIWDTGNFLEYPEVWRRYHERVTKVEQERFFSEF